MSKKSILIALISLLAAVLLIAGAFVIHTSADTDSEDPIALSEGYIGTYTINREDSLWTIAERYANDFHCDTNSYVTALREINHIDGEKILPGDTLVILYLNNQ